MLPIKRAYVATFAASVFALGAVIAVDRPDDRGAAARAVAAADLASTDRATGPVTVISRGWQLQGALGFAPISVSGSGRYVAFVGDDDQVYVRDRWKGLTRPVSNRKGGRPFWGDSPQISGDGRFVVFEHTESGDTGFRTFLYVRDLRRHRIFPAAVNRRGRPVRAEAARISANGRFIAFESPASSIVRGDTNRSMDVFVRDLWNRTTVRVSVSGTGRQANDNSYAPTAVVTGLSGQPVVFFATYASNLTRNHHPGLVGHNLTTGQTWWTAPDYWAVADAPDFHRHYAYDVSTDGRYFAYATGRCHRVRCSVRVYVRDRRTHSVRLVSVDNHNRPLKGQCGITTVSLSADGSVVVFDARTFKSKYSQVWLRDLRRNRTRLVSVALNGRGGNGSSDYADVSGRGHTVAFYSEASNLVRHDSNYDVDAFVRQMS